MSPGGQTGLLKLQRFVEELELLTGRKADLVTKGVAQAGPLHPGYGASAVAFHAARARYIEALRAADNHDVGPLLSFARA